MSWKALNRMESVSEPKAVELLTDALKEKIRSFFPRYETKRAVLLPALHIVQEHFGHINYPLMKEVAAILDIHPSDVMDVVSFYTHFHSHPKGKKTIVVCRSLSCELMGGKKLLDDLKQRLGVNEHETTSDGQYTLVTEECLAGCDHAPCLLMNERMHRSVKPEQIESILVDPHNTQLPIPRSSLFDPPDHSTTGTHQAT